MPGNDSQNISRRMEKPTEKSHTVLVPINFPAKILSKIDDAVEMKLLKSREHVLQEMAQNIVDQGLCYYAMKEPSFTNDLTAAMKKARPELFD